MNRLSGCLTFPKSLDGKGFHFEYVYKESGCYPGGTSGDIVCGHWHRWREDIRLREKWGIQAYGARFAGRECFRMVLEKQTRRDWASLIRRSMDGRQWHSSMGYLFHRDYPCDLFLQVGWLDPESLFA